VKARVVALVFLLATSILLISTPKIVKASTSTFGYTSLSGMSEDNTLDFGTSYPFLLENITSPSDFGSLNQISVYMGAVSGSVDAVACVYGDSLGGPNAKLAQSSEVSGIGTSMSWVNFTIALSGYPNIQYWFGVFASGDFNIYFSNSGYYIAVSWDSVTYPTLPNPYVTDYHFHSNIYALYASYTPGYSGPTPTPEPATYVAQMHINDPRGGNVSLEDLTTGHIENGNYDAGPIMSFTAGDRLKLNATSAGNDPSLPRYFWYFTYTVNEGNTVYQVANNTVLTVSGNLYIVADYESSQLAPAPGGGGGWSSVPSSTPTQGGGIAKPSPIQQLLNALSKIPPWALWAIIAVMIIAGVAGVLKGNKKTANPSRSFSPGAL